MTEEWDGRERRADQASLQREIHATRQDLGRLATAVTTLGSDEKLQAAIDSVAEGQRRHWQRLIAIVTAALLTIGVVVAVGATWANDAKDAAKEAGKVSRYVDHCLVHPAAATPGECGNSTATGQQSAAVLAIFCYLRIAPAARTDTNARECFNQALAQSTTTTTR